jgi:hypothetical protein
MILSSITRVVDGKERKTTHVFDYDDEDGQSHDPSGVPSKLSDKSVRRTRRRPSAPPDAYSSKCAPEAQRKDRDRDEYYDLNPIHRHSTLVKRARPPAGVYKEKGRVSGPDKEESDDSLPDSESSDSDESSTDESQCKGQPEF